MVVSAEIWHKVFDRANGYCEYCGEDLLISRAAYASAQVDHVLGRAEGGLHGLENLRLACSQCNSSLSRYNRLQTFEERKALVLQKIKEYHQRNYNEKRGKLRGLVALTSADSMKDAASAAPDPASTNPGSAILDAGIPEVLS
jgi:hypothetical protein